MLRQGLLAAGLFLAATALAVPALAGPPPAQRQTDLLYLLKQDCGSCHGLTMKGGLGPPLLPENLEGRDDETLTQIILDGLSGTPMPPWRPLLRPREAAWMVEQLREGLGP